MIDSIDMIVQLQLEIAGSEIDSRAIDDLIELRQQELSEWDLIQDLDSNGGDWDEADRAEWHAWLDSLAPDCEECELRDAFLGHLD